MLYAKISTYLATDLETVKSYLMTQRYSIMCAGLMKFHPIEQISFRQNGLREVPCKNVRISFLPIGKQIVGIEFPKNPIIGFSEIMEVVL
ncbi:MAG: hypothetical protein CM15mP86_18980 [Gammaproteobacteria bacterium]|nr:MAG: hypothetical protein CM15mP86_18980 [Gammaproteobacteria bacterium]